MCELGGNVCDGEQEGIDAKTNAQKEASTPHAPADLVQKVRGKHGRHPVGARRRGLGREEGDVLHLSTPEGVGLDLRRSWNSYHNLESVGEISAWRYARCL